MQSGSEGPAPVRNRPANENDPGIAMMLAKLRRQPSYGVFYAAFAISLIWIFGWFLVHSSEIFVSTNNATPSLPDMMRAVAVLVIPIAVFWSLAYFQWRAQQLRQVSEVLMQSALRLVRPQDIASENLTSIAQAVRQEVDLLVGGIEHAYKRASALEDIVHKEMSAVERAFGANEDRIRGLVSGLESQRVALQQTSQIVGGEAGPLLTRMESNTQNLGQVINIAMQTFNRLESGLKQSSEELARTIDDVSVRAAIAGNEIGGHSQQFERMSTMLIGDFRDFSSQLSGYVHTLNNAASTLSSESLKFGGEVKGMESNLVQLLRISADQLNSANLEAGDTIQRLSTASVSDIRNATGELQQTVNSIGENITYHLRATSSEFASLIEKSGVDTAQRIEDSRNIVTMGLQSVAGDFINKVSKASTDLTGYVDIAANQITSSYDIAASRLSDRIDVAGTQMLAGLDQTGNQYLIQLNTSGADFAARIEQASSALTGVLQSNASEVTNTIATTAENYNGRLGATAQQILTDIDNSAKNLLTNLSSGGAEYAGRIEQAASGLTGHLSQHSNAVVDAIRSSTQEYTGQIEGSATNLLASIDQTAKNLLNGLSTGGGDYVGRIELAATGMTSHLGQHSNAIVDAIRTSTQDYTGQIEASATTILSGIDMSARNLLTSLNSGGDDYSTRIEQATAGLTGQLAQQATVVTDAIRSTTESLSATFDHAYGRTIQTFNETVERLDASGETIGQRIEGSSSLVINQMQSAGSSFNDLMVSTSGAITAHLRETSDIVNRQMQESGIAVAQNISASSNDVTDRLLSISDNFVEKLGTTRDGMVQVLENSSGTLVQQLQGTATQLFARLEQASNHVADQMESIALRVNENIDNTAGSVTTRVVDVTERLTQQLDVSSAQLGTLLETTESRLGSQLELATSELTGLFTSNTDRMTSQLGSTARELGERLDVATSHLDQVTGDVTQRLSTTSTSLIQTLDEATSEIQTNLGKVQNAFTSNLDRVQGAFSDGLGQTTMEITGRFEQETGLLVGRIDRATEQLNAAASTSGKSLDDAHRKFSGHVQTANTYFADQIGTAATELDTKLEGISMQLTGKLEVTGTRMSERLEDVTALVDRSINKFNAEMEHMLASRRDTLDGLVNDASRRAQEVDAVMTGYMNMIEESLTAAELRARDISRIVSDQTVQSMTRLEDELKKLEGSSTTQVNQAARVLREQHERALSSMNEMLSSTATDFQQTAQDMRVTAQQVVKDIDAARNELKRAVIELPEETRNNADAMRRVVADQISALNALSEVVRKQSGSLDFSGPGYIAPRGSGPGKSEGATFAAPLSGTIGTRENQMERTAEVRKPVAAPGIEGAMAQIAASVEALSTKAVQRPALRRKPTTLNELPAAVVREIGSFSAKLNVAAREVAEAIDDGLPRDLEKRYVNGDTEVYVKRLHETRSKRAVTSLMNRYAGERLLRTRINGYIRLFEKLLDTLAEVPNGSDTIDAVLASQNGEVYLMLAEASGRVSER